MAELTGPFRFKGPLGNFSCYWNSALQKWIVRSKGGANKNLIENNPAFARTRENMSEFAACGRWCHLLRVGLFELDELNYGMYMSGIVSLSKLIQKMDIDGPRGYRSLYSSKCKSLLTDINFNTNHPFKQVLLRQPIVTTNDVRTTVTVELPGFLPCRDFNWKEKSTLYRFTLLIAQLSDYTGDAETKTYGPQYFGLEGRSVACFGEWLGKDTEVTDISMTASFKEGHIPPADATVLVGLGIEFASTHTGRAIYAEKGDGTMALVACL
jgi:hypothetical protein